MRRLALLLVLAVGTLASAVSTSCPPAMANALLPYHLRARGMTLTVDDIDAPRAEGNFWALSHKGHEAPEILFTISLTAKTVCQAQVVGSRGFPTPYAPMLEAEYYPNGRAHERTLVLSSIKTDESFRGMGCATALMSAMDVWLRGRYSRDDVEVIYLLDHSRMPGFYERRGWHTTTPLSWSIVTKSLHPEGQGTALASGGAVRMHALTPHAMAPLLHAAEALLIRPATESVTDPLAAADDDVELEIAAEALTSVTILATIASIASAIASQEDVSSLLVTGAAVAVVSLWMAGARDDAASKPSAD